MTNSNEGWILVLILCQSCGGDMMVKLFDHKPTEEEQSAFKRTMHVQSASCLSVYISQLDEDGECEIEPEN